MSKFSEFTINDNVINIKNSENAYKFHLWIYHKNFRNKNSKPS